jgi:uncharacterized membrane protein YphA (DoxX/SURF4 family)
MSFSQTAGTSIVPLLSRIVLGIAFLSTGYNKLFTTVEYTADDARMLDQMGVTVTTDAALDLRTADVLPAAFQQARPQDNEETTGEDSSAGDEEGQPDAGAQPVPAGTSEEPPAQRGDDGASTAGTSPAMAGTALGLYQVSLLMKRGSLPYPVAGGWVAAIIEFAGGILLLLGLLSRVWGLGLTITMGTAFYLTTMQGVAGPAVFSVWPWEFARESLAFSTMYTQLGLGVLAFGIFLTGPGPFSLDRLLFGGRKKEEPHVMYTSHTPQSGSAAPMPVPTPAPPKPPQPQPTPTEPSEPPARRPL